MALLQLTIPENGISVCSIFEMTPQVRHWVVMQFIQPAVQLRLLRGTFEEEVKELKAAEQRVLAMFEKRRHGGARLKEKVPRLSDNAGTHRGC